MKNLVQLFYCFAEEVILAEERTTEEEKMHIIEGGSSYTNLKYI